MKIIKNLTKWQNYAHYLLLEIGLLATYHITVVTGILPETNFHEVSNPLLLFGLGYLALLVIDTLVHLVFSILPKPYRWED